MNSKLKNILVLTSTFPINNEDGVPSFVKDQIISLKKYDPELNFTIIAPSYGSDKAVIDDRFVQLRYRYFISQFENLTKNGILPTIKNNFLYLFVVPFFIIFQIKFTLKTVRKIKPDIVYAHWVTPQAITALIVKKVLKTPYVFTTHAHDAEILGKIPFIGKKILNSIVLNSSKFTSVSINTEMKLKKLIKPSIWNENKSLVFPMGIRNTLFESCEEEGIENINKNEKLKFTFIGRFSEKKGVEKLINSFANLLNNKDNLELIICGSGYLRNDYIKLIKSLNIEENVILSSNFLNTSELKFIYNISDFIVIPSIITKKGDVEGLPLVLMESLYFGKVVIASSQSNAEEIISNTTNGFIFNSDITGDLEKLINEILENKYDLAKIKNKAAVEGKKYISQNVAKIYYEHLFC